MKLRLVVAALLVSPALAADFAARVEEARVAEAAEVGGQYGSTFFSAYMDAMSHCLPSKPAASNETLSFTFVAYVAPDGTLRSVEVQPASKFALCFADQLKAQKFSAPPRATSLDGYPIFVEVGPKP